MAAKRALTYSMHITAAMRPKEGDKINVRLKVILFQEKKLMSEKVNWRAFQDIIR